MSNEKDKKLNGGAPEDDNNQSAEKDGKTHENNAQVDINNAIAKLIDAETSPNMLALKELLYRRVAMEAVIRPSRIPAPRNITEIGGYLNLLMQVEQSNLLRENQMLKETLGSILGLPEKPNL